MKIIFLSDDYPPNALGGAGVIVRNIACGLAQQGHAISVITTVSRASAVGTRVEEGVTIYSIFSAYNHSWRAYVSLRNTQTLPYIERILRDIDPDIVHAHNIHLHLSYASLALAKKYAKNVFITFHDSMAVAYGKVWPEKEECGSAYHVSWVSNLKGAGFGYNPFRNIIIRRYLRNVDQIFAVSNALRVFLEQSGLPKMEVMHNGLTIHNSNFDISNDDFLKTNNLYGKRVLFLGGRISHAKGAYVAIDMLVRLRTSISGVVLFFAGSDAEQREKILTYAYKRGVKDCVSIALWLTSEDMQKIYHTASIVLVPSLYLDPFPTVNLEAALHKKPVIAGCFGGSKEFIIDGETGYIVNPYDSDFFTRRVEDLLYHSEIAEQFGKNNFKRLSNNFFLGKQLSILLERYKIMLNKK